MAHRSLKGRAMTAVMVIIAMLAAIPVLGIIIMLMLGNRSAFFTTIEEGSTISINIGESVRYIWANIQGFMMSESKDLEGHHWLIPAPSAEAWTESFFRDARTETVPLQRFLWKRFHVRLMAIFWPHTRLHSIVIDRKRLLVASDAAGVALKDRVIKSPEPSRVRSLHFVVPRPVYVQGIDLPGDNAKINLLVLPIFRQVIPYVPIYFYKGDFFPPLDAAIEAALIDFFASHRVAVYKEGSRKGEFAGEEYNPGGDEAHDPAPISYAHWLKMKKGGEGSALEKSLRNLNVSQGFIDALRERLGDDNALVQYAKSLALGEPAQEARMGDETTKQIPHGIVPRFGFALRSFRLVAWEEHGDTVDLARALRERETKFRVAEGIRVEADGERDAILARALGESTRYRQLLEALTGEGVDPNVAAEVVRTQLRTENIRDSDLTTYVEGGDARTRRGGGGARTAIMVPATAPKRSSEEGDEG